MKFIIKHEIPGRIRIHIVQKRMTAEEADTLLYYLNTLEYVTQAKVYGRTADACVCFAGEREPLIRALRKFRYTSVKVPDTVFAGSGRKLNTTYQEKLISKVVLHYAGKLFLPCPVRAVWTTVKSIRYLKEGLRCLIKGKLEVSVLDAAAIGVSLLRGDINTASSVMFLLGIGETMEEWTHKKSVGDLARSMSLNVSKVWLKKDGQEILMDSRTIKEGDEIVVHMGNVIPFDGTVTEGNGMVNQASLTGEPLPVHREKGGYVYAGSVLEEGELVFAVQKASGASRYEKIVTMIEESEKLKSSVESKAERLADRLVPVTLAGTALVWLTTRNITKTLAVLMVDFSCALKLAMPITVLSAIRQAGNYEVTVKGGKYLEAVAEAETIVFDKTGTLTTANPTVKKVVPFCKMEERELLRLAACLEEHFPHPVARAVVRRAEEENLHHQEEHADVKYVVAHGIASELRGQRVFIGSRHYIEQDEGISVESMLPEVARLAEAGQSVLYLAINNDIAGLIGVEDPLRRESPEIIRSLREHGARRIVMLTGDDERSAAAVARRLGIDEYRAQVLPTDKAEIVKSLKDEGFRVLMIGDGINDSPALSAADAGVTLRDGADLARDVADVVLTRVGLNTLYLAGSLFGLLPPGGSAVLHNLTTLGVCVNAMRPVFGGVEG